LPCKHIDKLYRRIHSPLHGKRVCRLRQPGLAYTLCTMRARDISV
jgi:hypothetical protein